MSRRLMIAIGTLLFSSCAPGKTDSECMTPLVDLQNLSQSNDASDVVDGSEGFFRATQVRYYLQKEGSVQYKSWGQEKPTHTLTLEENIEDEALPQVQCRNGNPNIDMSFTSVSYPELISRRDGTIVQSERTLKVTNGTVYSHKTLIQGQGDLRGYIADLRSKNFGDESKGTFYRRENGGISLVVQQRSTLSQDSKLLFLRVDYERAR